MRPIFITSLLASVFGMVPALALFLAAALWGSTVVAGGEVDNDPMRAGWLFLYLSPLFFLLYAAYFFFATLMLWSFGKLTFLYLIALSTLTSLLIAYQSTASDPVDFGLTFGICLVWLTIGATSWFVLWHRRIKPSKQTPASRTGSS